MLTQCRKYITGDCLQVMRSLPSASVGLVFTSPPYEDARTYGLDFRLKGQARVDWLAVRIVEAARVSAGLVCVNAASRVMGGRYSAAIEWLVADLTRIHGLVCGSSPYAWTKNGIPGSGGKKYHRRNWEPVYCFAMPDRIPLRWADPLAYGSPPKFGPGGNPSNRTRSGRRVNGKPYKPLSVSNPGNVIHVPVGGGMIGGDLAHKTEAPMPVGLAERFVRWYCPPGETVLDPFGGSGTTAVAAVLHGRGFVTIDVRDSQTELAIKRVEVAAQMREDANVDSHEEDHQYSTGRVEFFAAADAGRNSETTS